MLEERKVAHCVDSIITQYYYFIIVIWAANAAWGGRRGLREMRREEGEGQTIIIIIRAKKKAGRNRKPMREKQAGDGNRCRSSIYIYRGGIGPDQHQSESMVKWRGGVTTERSSCCTVWSWGVKVIYIWKNGSGSGESEGDEKSGGKDGGGRCVYYYYHWWEMRDEE